MKKFVKESLTESLLEYSLEPHHLSKNWRRDESGQNDEHEATNEVMSETSIALEELFQRAAENGLTFEMLQELSEEALDQVDWAQAGQM